jgi:hypothetical protein
MFSNAEKLQCIERELRMRRGVYPRWVAANRMSEAKAKREIELMKAVYEDYLKVCVGADLFE